MYGLFLRWKNRVFHAFADAELERRFGRNLDGLARLGIPADAGLPVGEDELAERVQRGHHTPPPPPRPARAEADVRGGIAAGASFAQIFEPC